MNKTDIEWTDYTWNPVTGCKHGCPYCYARNMYHRFGWNWEPTLHPERLRQPLEKKSSKKIFVGSVTDLFGDWVHREWWELIFDTVKVCSWHTFQFLTKNPKRLQELNPWPDNCWVGVTATNQKMWNSAVLHLGKVDAKVKFLSVEPLLEPIRMKENPWIDWLIIGALSKGKEKVQPPGEMVDNLIADAREHDIAIFTKDNLSDYNIKEYPNRRNGSNGPNCGKQFTIF